MPITITIDREARLVTQDVTGRVTFDEILQAIDKVYSDPGFHNSMDVIVDVMPGATAGLTSVELSGVVNALKGKGERRGTARTALVAATEADYGIARVLSHVLQGGTREMQVFRDLAAALTWLGR
jgi:hypothetical protein